MRAAATEMLKTALALGTASLETSITVACPPRVAGSAVSFRAVRGEIEDRGVRRGLGIDPNPPHIDALHRSMLLWKEEKRKNLVGYLGERDLLEDGPFWKLAQALFEVLPRDLEYWKLVNALLGERQALRTEGKRTAYGDAQRGLFFDEGGEKRS